MSYEIIMLGRGGQGIVLGAEILVTALMHAGLEVQYFPDFAAERRGAPIKAFARASPAIIHLRCRVYNADALLVFDPTVLDQESLKSLKPDGIILLSSPRAISLGDINSFRLDARAIAVKNRVFSSEGFPLGGMAMLGAFLKITGLASLDELKWAIAKKLGAATEKNTLCACDGFAAVKKQKKTRKIELPAASSAAKEFIMPDFPITTGTTLDAPTGSWRMAEPRFTEKCTACSLCEVFCPDGAIYADNDTMKVDTRFCKGCEICVNVCPIAGAISMEAAS